MLLFGPTDPDIWAPLHAGIQIVRADDETMPGIALADVQAAVRERLALALTTEDAENTEDTEEEISFAAPGEALSIFRRPWIRRV